MSDFPSGETRKFVTWLLTSRIDVEKLIAEARAEEAKSGYQAEEAEFLEIAIEGIVLGILEEQVPAFRSSGSSDHEWVSAHPRESLMISLLSRAFEEIDFDAAARFLLAKPPSMGEDVGPSNN